MKDSRIEINKIDEAIIKLIAKRFEEVKEIQDHKKMNNLESYDPDREHELKKLHDTVALECGINPKLIEDLFQRIFKESRGAIS